jgi:sugar lactone lactonase YvrE
LRYRHSALLSAIALAGFATAQVAIPATAATAPLSNAREVAHFDVTALQQPENITLEPDGAAVVTFNRARQVARVGRDGSVSILATFPAPATGTAGVSGIVRVDDGSFFVNYNAGSLTGVWRIGPHGGTPVQVVALPGVKAPNGLALDSETGNLYVTDSTSGTVWRVSPRTRTASLWAQGPELVPPAGSGFGANGIKVHDDAVWVSNTGQGTLLRFAIGRHGAAGAVTTVAQGLTAIDDFMFTGHGDTVLAALNGVNEVSLVHPDGTHQIVLTSTDGLSSPTSIAVRGSTVYVASAAYASRIDPNLLLAKLDESR